MVVSEDSHYDPKNTSLLNFGVGESAGFCVNVIEFVLNDLALFCSWVE